jgi:hypothetical protein
VGRFLVKLLQDDGLPLVAVSHRFAWAALVPQAGQAVPDKAVTPFEDHISSLAQFLEFPSSRLAPE